MNNEDNPFYTIATAIKSPHKSNREVIFLGKVISVNPLLINCEGIQLDRKDLLINKDLLKSTKRKVKMDTTDVKGKVLIGSTEGDLESFDMTEGIVENLEDNLAVGSIVVLLTNDNQKFILLCEVI